jgi:hypothetical protein
VLCGTLTQHARFPPDGPGVPHTEPLRHLRRCSAFGPQRTVSIGGAPRTDQHSRSPPPAAAENPDTIKYVSKDPGIPDASQADIDRINTLLRAIGGPNVNWGAVNILDVWIIEQRLKAEDKASSRLLIATWVLAAATLGLVIATVGLIVAAH